MARYAHFKVWLDGKIVDPEAATLSVFTLTVLRGANVYEGLRAYWNPARRDLYVWKLDEHLKRLGCRRAPGVAVPSAPGVAGVRVWEVMSRGRGPRGRCPPPEGVDVAYPLTEMGTTLYDLPWASR
jgi:hypothetical protein